MRCSQCTGPNGQCGLLCRCDCHERPPAEFVSRPAEEPRPEQKGGDAKCADARQESPASAINPTSLGSDGGTGHPAPRPEDAAADRADYEIDTIERLRALPPLPCAWRSPRNAPCQHMPLHWVHRSRERGHAYAAPPADRRESEPEAAKVDGDGIRDVLRAALHEQADRVADEIGDFAVELLRYRARSGAERG